MVTFVVAVLVEAEAETELVLIDGRVLIGESVERDGGEFVLTFRDGTTVTLPVELVKTVRLGMDEGEDEPEEQEPPRSNMLPGFRDVGPEEFGTAPPPGPSGIRSDGPQQLAGSEVRFPSRSEQTEAIGPPARFTPDVVENDWVPTTDWNMDPEVQNNWAPSDWAEDIVDNSWEPESAFDEDEDVLEASRSTWSKGVIDSSWAPTDGFKSSVSNKRR